MEDSSQGSSRPRQGPSPVRRVHPLDPASRLASRYHHAPRITLGATAQLQLLPGMPSDEALRVLQAIPEGFQRAGSAAAWCRYVEQHPALAELRQDARENALSVLWVLARYSDHRTKLTRPTWARLQAVTSLSRASVARWLRWAREHRLIGHVEMGSTERYRTGQTVEDLGNRSAVYILITETPSPDPTSLPNPTRTREAELSTKPTALRAVGSDLRIQRTAADRLAAAEHLQERVPVARRLSAKHVRSLLRDFLVAGWCVRDVHHALDHVPAGDEHPYAYASADVRHPAGWISSRLNHWRDQAGAPIASRRQQQQADADQIRAARAPRPEQVACPLQDVTSSLQDHDHDHAVSLAHDRELRAQARAAREREERERIEAWKSAPPAAVDPAQRRAEVRRRALARARLERQGARDGTSSEEHPGAGRAPRRSVLASSRSAMQ